MPKFPIMHIPAVIMISIRNVMILLQNMMIFEVMTDIMLKGKQSIAKYSHKNIFTPVMTMHTIYLCLSPNLIPQLFLPIVINNKDINIVSFM